MNRPLALPGVLAALATAGPAAALVAAPGSRTAAWAAYALALGALGLVSAVRAIGRAWPVSPSVFEAALRAPVPRPVRLRQLARLEDDVAEATVDPRAFERGLRPLLHEIAAERLASAHGIDLERRPEAARTLLGTEPWDLLAGTAATTSGPSHGPARPGRRGSRRPLRLAHLARLVDALERLER